MRLILLEKNLQMHLIHYNNKKYRSYNQALDSRNGNVAVLAIFFNINKNDNDYNDDQMTLLAFILI